MLSNLSVQETLAYELLQRGDDVLIADLYRRMKQLRKEDPLTDRKGNVIDNRTAQCIVGSTMHRINRKLAKTGKQIKPGEKRRTYRIYKIQKAEC